MNFKRVNIYINLSKYGACMFNERLRKIREETQLNQEEFAKLGGVKISAQANYERGLRYPTLEYLLKLSEAGIDVAYLVTGIVSNHNLNDEENELLSSYRSASSEKKYALMLMARTIEKKPDDEGGMPQPDPKVTQKTDNELNNDNVSSYKKADRIRNLSSLNKTMPLLLGIALLVYICLVFFGEYSYLLSEDPSKANILSLALFSMISVVLIGVGVIYAERIFNVKDSNAIRMRQIKALFKK